MANLLTASQSGFENGQANGWSMTSGSFQVDGPVDGPPAWSGTRSLRATATGTVLDAFGPSPYIPAVPGGNYQASAMLWSPQGGRPVQLRLDWLNRATGPQLPLPAGALLQVAGPVVTIPAGGGHVMAAVSGARPSWATHARINAWMMSGVVAGNALGVDDVILEQVPGYELSRTEGYGFAWWPMHADWEWVSGAAVARVADAGGSGYHAVPNNMVAPGDSGYVNTAMPPLGGSLEFSGSSWMTTSLSLGDRWSLSGEFWINLLGQNPTADAYIVGNAWPANSPHGFAAYVESGTRWIRIAIGTGRGVYSARGGLPNSTGWHHVAWSFGGAGLGNRLRLYIDGSQADVTTTTDYMDCSAGTTTVGMGRRYGGTVSASYLRAAVSNLALYYGGPGGILSPAQVAARWNAGQPPGLKVATTVLAPGEAGHAYRLPVAAQAGVPPYTWAASGLPAGMTLSPAGLISGTPAAGFGAGTVRLTATDRAGQNATASLPLTVIDPLTQPSGPLPPVRAGQHYSHTLTAEGGATPYLWAVQWWLDDDGDAAYSWQVSGLSAGLSHDSGVITGTPVTVGIQNVSIRVTDARGTTNTVTRPLEVLPPLLTIDDADLPPGRAGDEYEATLSASYDNVTWSDDGLPAGLTRDGAVITGIPEQPGIHVITVTAAEPGGQTATAGLDLWVQYSGLTVVTGPGLDDAVAGQDYVMLLDADGGVPPYAWSAPGPQLLEGESADFEDGPGGWRAWHNADAPVRRGPFTLPREGQYVLGWLSPANGESSVASPEIPVTTGVHYAAAAYLVAAPAGTSEQSVRLAIAWLDPAGVQLSITSGEIATVPAGTAGLARWSYVTAEGIAPAGATAAAVVAVTLTAQAGSWKQVDIISFAVASGLPEGLTLDGDTGLIHGVPLEPGTFSIALAAADSGPENGDPPAARQSAETTVTLHVGDPLPLEVSAALPRELDAGEDLDPPVPAEAAGGVPPFAFTVTGLPHGMEAQGPLISGRPDVTGLFHPVVTAWDRAGVQASATLALTVRAVWPHVIWDGMECSPGHVNPDDEDPRRLFTLAVTEVEGWHDGPAKESNMVSRVLADGAGWGRPQLRERRITIKGKAAGPHGDLMALRDELAGKAAGREPADLMISDWSHGRRHATVLADEDTFGFEFFGGDQGATWQITFTAADPRLYGDWQNAVISPAHAETGRTYPRTYPWSYGPGLTPNQALLRNPGNITTTAYALYTGPLAASRLTDGHRSVHVRALGDGEQLHVDTGSLQATAPGGLSRGSKILPGSQPLEVACGETRWSLYATGTGHVEIGWRAAWA